MFNGILWIARSGAAWRDDETLVTIFYALNSDADFENLSINSTIKKCISTVPMLKMAVDAEVNQCICKSRDGITTKIHADVDGLGNLLYFELSSDHVNVNTIAIDLLSNIDIKSANILGNKTYGTKVIRTYITSQEAVYTIPPKSNTINHGIVPGGFIKNAIWLNAFLIKSSIFEELLHDMTSWHLRFMPLFTLRHLVFIKMTSISTFQTHPS